MEKIDKYLNSIYRDINASSKETEDLKQEMKDHLIETVRELQHNGLTEDESIRIAIERFGEEFQIRNELNQVVKFQKVFAQKILRASFILLAISAIFLISASFINQNYSKRYSTLSEQIRLAKNEFMNEGINSVDRYVKELFRNEDNNQLTYIAIKELPRNYDNSNSMVSFPSGDIKYSYPEKIKNEYYGNRFGYELISNNTKYFFEIGVKDSANSNPTSLYIGLAVLTFVICWVLWIIWSIINVYRYGKLNTKWCILLILTGIIGYFIFSIYYNPNNSDNNKRNKLIYIAAFFLMIISVLVVYYINEPYRLRRLLQLIS